MNKKSTTLIAVIILLIVLAGTGLIFSKKYLLNSEKPSENTQVNKVNTTRNWKTYRNAAYFFSIQYPQQMTIVEDIKMAMNYITVAKLSTENYSVIIRVIDDLDIYNKMKTNDVAKREITDSGFKYTLINLQINGLAVTKTKVNDPANRIIVTFKNPNKNRFIEITFSGPNHVLDDQILSSFKFLNDQVTNTNNWKTYVDDFSKISFKYPTDLSVSEKIFADDSKSIYVRGKEGDLNIIIFKASAGNSPGWGGGCDPKDHVTKYLIDKQNEFCEGETYISQIYLTRTDKSFEFQISAKILFPFPENKDIFYRIISSINYNK